MNVYIPVGAHAEKNITTQIGGTKVSDGSEVQLALFWLTPNGSTATLNATDRQGKAYLEGSAATLTLGDWHRITMVIDKETAVIDYYVDGEFAYTARNQSDGTMAEVNAPINITKDSILFQVNRLHDTTEMLQGILQIDDVALYTSTDGLGLTRNVPAFRQNFETETSVENAFSTISGSLSAALVPSATDATNQVVQVDLKGMSPNGEYCLVDYNGKYCGHPHDPGNHGTGR